MRRYARIRRSSRCWAGALLWLVVWVTALGMGVFVASTSAATADFWCFWPEPAHPGTETWLVQCMPLVLCHLRHMHHHAVGCSLSRNILADKPRVTKFPIAWDSALPASTATAAAGQDALDMKTAHAGNVADISAMGMEVDA